MAYVVTYEKDVTEEEQTKFELALNEARVAATSAKNTVEATWLGVAGDQRVTTEAWFKLHYAGAKGMIGPSQRLTSTIKELEKKVVYSVAASGGSAWKVSCADKLICTVSVYQVPAETPELLPDTKRPIYKHNGKDYVLDDDGLLTRRIAFCVRRQATTRVAPEIKPVPVELSWKFANATEDWAVAMTQAVVAASAGRDTWSALSVEAKICLAYLNYANNGQLGICLSSTPKRIRANDGKAFADKADYLIWKVDLAKIPTTSVLVNIYAREPTDEGWSASTVKPGKGGKGPKTVTRGADWIAQGTVKNRELFCSDVPEEAAESTSISAAMLEANNWSWKTEAWFTTL